MKTDDTRNEKLHNLVSRQCDRAIAIVLDFKERECDRHLPPATQHRLRKVVLDQLNDFAAFCEDLLDSVDTGEVVLNDIFLEMLTQIRDVVVGDDDGD